MFWASDNEKHRPFLFPRVLLECALLGFVAANLGLIAVATKRYPPFFSQPGAHNFVLEPVLALLAYALAIVLTSRARAYSGKILCLRVAAWFAMRSH